MVNPQLVGFLIETYDRVQYKIESREGEGLNCLELSQKLLNYFAPFTWLVEFYLSAEMQSVYSTAPANWTITTFCPRELWFSPFKLANPELSFLISRFKR